MTTSKMGIERVAILGANSLLAHHLLMTSLPDCHKESPLKAISLWNFDDEFTFSQTSDISERFDGVDLKLFSGMLSLRSAIDGCDTIFNLHEVHDFSVVPDKRALKTHNVGVVQILLKLCEFVQVPVRIVHLSSVYLQVSSRWPNVYGREAGDYFHKFREENPFPAYCSSKYEAEQLLALASSDNLQSVSARIGPLYGEGDRCSLICDSILLSKHHPQIPLVGDQSGVLQLTYAGNAADALVKCAKKLADDSTVRNELVLIGDATPIRNFYDLAIKPLYEEDKEDKGESAFQPKISPRRISFHIFYPFYCLLAFIGYLVSKMFNVKTGLSKIPSPSYAYLVFYHWTFFSDFKLRTFFDYVPRFDYPTSMKRSLSYYRKLTPDKIAKYSWMP